MFDLRYHVASLAAVFLALAVGILLGVAISGKLSDAEESLRADEFADLEAQLNQERVRADAVERRGQAAEDLVESAYPALMEGRLEDKLFAILFLGPVDGRLRSAVERTLSDADSGAPGKLIALDIPLDVEGLDGALAGDEQLAVYAEQGDDFGDLGEALGQEFMQGGETSLWSTLSSELIAERSGASSVEVDGAIVVHSWTPPEGEDADEASRVRATRTLIDGLLRGLEAFGFPVVGVETLTSSESAIEVYRRQGVSSVDNLDTLPGRLALALLLAGGPSGHYGVKDSADEVVPPVEPVPVAEGAP